MTSREIREHLGRVKPYYLRKETERALASAITALRGAGNGPFPTDLRSPLREAVQLLARDPDVMKFIPSPLIYQPGQEKIILLLLAKAYKGLREEASFEDHDTALARKISLDQNFNQGVKHLEQGRVSEADASFSDALNYYVDEHRIFAMIGQALMTAGEIRRAYPYFKRGAEASPSDKNMQELFEQCAAQREALRNN